MKETDTKKADFSARLKELEQITLWFESEEIDLDQALIKFERGMTLAAELKAYLTQVENRVEKIKQKFDQPAAPMPQAEEANEVNNGAAESEDSPAPDLFS